MAAEFAEILRGSYWAKESRLVDLVPVADGLAADCPATRRSRDLADMIRRAADLQSRRTEREPARTSSPRLPTGPGRG